MRLLFFSLFYKTRATTFAKITGQTLKFLAAAILLIAFTAQTFSKGLLILDYYANTASFEKDCVNKNNPMMHCCGRCQLRKKMQQQENNDKQYPEQRNGKNEMPLSSSSFFARAPLVIVTALNNNYPTLTNSKAIEMPHAIFRPPGA